jgi:hypothetical protein
MKYENELRTAQHQAIVTVHPIASSDPQVLHT